MATRRRQRGTGSVIKSGEGWRARRTSTDPITKTKSTQWKRFKTRRAAEDWLEEQRQVVPSSKEPVAGYLRLYERTHLVSLDIADSTRATRKRLIRNPLIPSLRDVTFEELQQQNVLLAWQARFEESRRLPRSDKDTDPPQLDSETRLQAFNVFKQILDQAVRDGYTSTNPLLRINRPRISKKPDAGFIHWKDVDEKLVPEIFRDFHSNPGLHALTLTLAYTGLRFGEAANLRWRDLQNGKLHVYRSKTDTSQLLRIPVMLDKTLRNLAQYQDPFNSGEEEYTWSAELEKEAERQYRLSVDVMERIQDPNRETPSREEIQQVSHLIGNSDYDPRGKELIFTNTEGNRIDRHNFYRDYKRLLKRAGIEIPPRPIHALRHGYAMRLLEKDKINIAIVSSLLGHNNIRTTINTYGHTQTIAEGIDLDAALEIPEHVDAEADKWSFFE